MDEVAQRIQQRTASYIAGRGGVSEQDLKNAWKVYDLYAEIGAPGTKLFAGVITEEYLTEWASLDSKCTVINRMMKSDATIRAVLNSMILPLLSASWSVGPPEPKEKDKGKPENTKLKSIAEEVENQLFHMTITWADFLRQCTSFLSYGFSVFEEVWGIDQKTKMIKLRKLAPRKQNTIKKWLTDEKGGLAGVEQRTYINKNDETEYVTRNIPIDKLVVFTWDQDGNDFEGTSILRAPYKHWNFKDKLYLIQAIGLERNAFGVPSITLPKGTDSDTKEYAKKVVKSARVHEEAGYLFPEGTTIEFLLGQIQSGALEAAINHHDNEITKSILAQFLQLGSGQTGSWALSKDQSDFFLMSLNAVANFIRDRINEYVIKRMVKLNWGEQEVYPELKCSDIVKYSRSETATLLGQLISSQIITVDNNLSEWTRKEMDLPPKDELTPEEEAAQVDPAELQYQQEMEKLKAAQQEPSETGLKEKVNEIIRLREEDKQTDKPATLLESVHKIVDEEGDKEYKEAMSKVKKSYMENIKGMDEKTFDECFRVPLEQMIGIDGEQIKNDAVRAIFEKQFGFDPGDRKFVDEDWNTTVDQPAHNEYVYQAPEAKYRPGQAPVFRDPRTGRLKYAKGAVIGGKHVGGEWAPSYGSQVEAIGLGVGAGVAVFKAFYTESFIKPIKRHINKFAANMNRKIPAIGKFYESMGRELDAEGNVLNINKTKIENIFDHDIIEYGTPAKSIESDLRSEGFTVSKHFKNASHEDFKKIHILEGKKSIAKVDILDLWNGDDINKDISVKFKDVMKNHKIDFNFKNGVFQNATVKSIPKGKWSKGPIAVAFGVAAGYIVDRLANRVFTKAIRHTHDVIQRAQGNMLTPDEAKEYENWYNQNYGKKSDMPVGRPRVRAILPDELRRGRGRPALVERDKEAERQAKVAEAHRKAREDYERNKEKYHRAMGFSERSYSIRRARV